MAENDLVRRGMFFGAAVAVALATFGTFSIGATFLGRADAAAEDGPGPDLVIQVDGQAKGRVVIDLLPDVAPEHVKRIVALAEAGDYDGVVFHRVIEGFMAQTGDVQFGKHAGDTSRAGMGGSDLPNLPAEFSNQPFKRGTVGMARSQDPNSANSQFFIMFDDAPHLDGQYTVVGRVVEGMDVVNKIKRGNSGRNGVVTDPDWMAKVTVEK
ncbi:peptidylprolyl isomerase [Haematobacter missouriensis]|nr:peptidylprolyl isomerase [Haematobacter missouriensis]KFI33984.1 peptidylprolyl isomerase [Haematobacter missouriensis]